MTRKREIKQEKRKDASKRKPESSQNDNSIISSSRSSKKIKLASEMEKQTVAVDDIGYGLVDMNLLVKLSSYFPCPKCSVKGHLAATVKTLGGQALQLNVDCEKCGQRSVAKQDLSETISGETHN